MDEVVEENKEAASGCGYIDFWSLSPTTLVDAEMLGELLGVAEEAVGGMVVKGELPNPISFADKFMWSVGGICDHTTERFRLMNEQDKASNNSVYVAFREAARTLLGKPMFDEIENLAFASMNVEREE